MNRKLPFVSPLSDLTFKCLWQSPNKDVQTFLRRIVTYLVGFDVQDFVLAATEVGATGIHGINSRLDILLRSKDGKIKINVELNNKKEEVQENKNRTYIYKIAGNFYSDIEENYDTEISVYQVNLNSYKNQENEDIIISNYELYDIEHNLKDESLKVSHVYLPKAKEVCYDSGKEIYYDLSMFMCTSYKMMEKYIKGNKERKAFMEEIIRYNKDVDFQNLYDHDEFEEILKKHQLKKATEEAKRKGEQKGMQKGVQKGMQEGMQKGIQKAQKEMIQSLYQNGISIELIAQSVKKSIEEVKEILNAE